MNEEFAIAIKNTWKKIVELSGKHGCVEGVHFDMPPLKNVI